MIILTLLHEGWKVVCGWLHVFEVMLNAAARVSDKS